MASKTSAKKKLCWNCEGNVSHQQENCPSCGVYLSPSSDSSKETLFAPPYKIEEASADSNEIPAAPYADQQSSKLSQEASLASIGDNADADRPNILVPLVLLPAGTVLFLFGLALFFFSRDGALTLRWNGTYWFLYLFLGLPLLVYGWRCLTRIQDDT